MAPATKPSESSHRVAGLGVVPGAPRSDYRRDGRYDGCDTGGVRGQTVDVAAALRIGWSAAAWSATHGTRGHAVFTLTVATSTFARSAKGNT